MSIHVVRKLRARVIVVVGDMFVTVTKDRWKSVPPRTTFPGRFIEQSGKDCEEATRHFVEQTGIPLSPTELHPETVRIDVGHRTYRVFVAKLEPERFEHVCRRRGVATHTWSELRAMSREGKDVSTTLSVLEALERYVFAKPIPSPLYGACSNGHPGFVGATCVTDECGRTILNSH